MYNNRKRKHTDRHTRARVQRTHITHIYRNGIQMPKHTHHTCIPHLTIKRCERACVSSFAVSLCVSNTKSQKSSSFLIDGITACCTGWFCYGGFGLGLTRCCCCCCCSSSSSLLLLLLLFVRLLYTVHFHHIHSFTHSFIISWCVYVLCIVDSFCIRSICFAMMMSTLGFFSWLPLLLLLLVTFDACSIRSFARSWIVHNTLVSSPIIHFICHGHSQYWRHHH